MQTEVAKYHAELTSERADQPGHFLFNTLNNIAALAVREKLLATATRHPEASGRGRCHRDQYGFVPLEKEMSYVNDYIDLQKMWPTSACSCHTPYGNLEDQQIAPSLIHTVRRDSSQARCQPR